MADVSQEDPSTKRTKHTLSQATIKSVLVAISNWICTEPETESLMSTIMPILSFGIIFGANWARREWAVRKVMGVIDKLITELEREAELPNTSRKRKVEIRDLNKTRKDHLLEDAEVVIKR